MLLLIFLLVLLVAIIIRIAYEVTHFGVTDYFVTTNKALDNQKNDIRIALISDLHSTRYGKDNKKLIDCIKDYNPDYVLIAGDMIIKYNPKKNHIALNLLKSLAKDFPVIYAYGNHETKQKINHSEKFNTFINELKDNSIIVLNNKLIQSNNKLLSIYGLELSNESYHLKEDNNLDFFDKGQLSTDEEFKILLAHTPYFAKYYDKHDFDLILCGHYHGGMVRLPFVGGLIASGFKFFPKYDNGMYKLDNSTMIVSRGLGTHSIPIRLFNKPELVLVNIHKSIS